MHVECNGRTAAIYRHTERNSDEDVVSDLDLSVCWQGQSSIMNNELLRIYTILSC